MSVHDQILRDIAVCWPTFQLATKTKIIQILIKNGVPAKDLKMKYGFNVEIRSNILKRAKTEVCLLELTLLNQSNVAFLVFSEQITKNYRHAHCV